MNRAVLAALLVCPMLMGQEGTGSRNTETTKLFRLRYALPSRVMELMGPVGYNMRSDNQMRVLVVQGTPAKLADAERLIKDLDQPESGAAPRDVEVTVYVIAASDKAQIPSPASAALDSVIKQMKSVFPYAGYEVLDTILVRSREGERADTRGVLRQVPEAQAQRSNSYALSYEAHLDPQAAGQHTVRLDRFQFTGVLSNNQTASFATHVDVREGQKVVVGKTNVDDGSSALFVVVTARVLGSEGETPGR